MRTTRRRKLTAEECEAARKGNVEFLNEKLVSLGVDFLASQAPMEGNILHVLIQCQFHNEDSMDEAIEFIEQAIQILPSLLSQQDRNGNTLLHLMLEKTSEYEFSLTRNSFKDLLMILEREALDHAKDGPHSSLYRLKTDKGDTPLHVAIRAKNYEFAIQLLKVDSEVAGYVNNRKQTPLHLLSPRYDDDDSETVEKLISCLISGNGDLPYMQDEDGLTPLLAAVREHNIKVIEKLYEMFPASVVIADFKGRTLWHWFGYRHVEVFYRTTGFEDLPGTLLMRQYQTHNIADILTMQDNDGNTPLHTAIANKQFNFAGRIIYISEVHAEDLLAIENKDGISCYDLIGSAEHLHPQFEEFLSWRGDLLSGHRSLYNIPTTKIEPYTNTIGVIAALLATITFTAAFTVPGGLDSSNGTPLLLRKAMFQVFMVADVVAMSSSVTVLFCLLWIMTTGNKKESILLLDVSVFLLQTSFYATLTTFMTGLYVTTISIVPAIAISTCIICTLLIILLNKKLVMLTVVPFFGTLITWFPIIIEYLKHTLSFLWDLIKELRDLIKEPKHLKECLGWSKNTDADESS